MPCGLVLGHFSTIHKLDMSKELDFTCPYLNIVLADCSSNPPGESVSDCKNDYVPDPSAHQAHNRLVTK